MSSRSCSISFISVVDFPDSIAGLQLRSHYSIIVYRPKDSYRFIEWEGFHKLRVDSECMKLMISCYSFSPSIHA